MLCHKVNETFRFLKKILLFLESRRKGKREGEKHRSLCERTWVGCLSHPTNRGPGLHPGMSPDWELNCPPFGLRIDTQPTEPH